MNSTLKFGDGIRMLRQMKRWSQEDMAYELKMSLAGYSKIERNITDVKYSRIVQISEVFKMKPSSLLSFIENPQLV
jgi:transcriptional regulator with XRE-family HTH domain